jgi:hypothetical protein
LFFVTFIPNWPFFFCWPFFFFFFFFIFFFVFFFCFFFYKSETLLSFWLCSSLLAGVKSREIAVLYSGYWGTFCSPVVVFGQWDCHMEKKSQPQVSLGFRIVTGPQTVSLNLTRLWTDFVFELTLSLNRLSLWTACSSRWLQKGSNRLIIVNAVGIEALAIGSKISWWLSKEWLYCP